MQNHDRVPIEIVLRCEVCGKVLKLFDKTDPQSMQVRRFVFTDWGHGEHGGQKRRILAEERDVAEDKVAC